MRIWIRALMVIFFLIPSPVAAQTSTTFSRVEVAIWPEYDRSEVLVIYHLYLSDTTSLPADLSVQIPTAAGDPFNVAVRETDGQLYNVAFERTIQGEWASIQFTSTASEVQFEYYDPGLMKDGDHRSYTYNWTGGYPVGSLTIQVQQPINAQDMVITPSLGTGIAGEGDLMYYQALLGEIPAGNEFKISISYEKPDDTLSIENLKVESSSPVNGETSGRMNISEFFPWILGFVGLVLISGGVWWYWQSGHEQNLPRIKKRHTTKTGGPEPTSENEINEIVYCHQCGKKSTSKDNFCRACGARLRREEQA